MIIFKFQATSLKNVPIGSRIENQHEHKANMSHICFFNYTKISL